MKLARLITVGAICVATGAFQGANVRSVAAEVSAVSTDAALASQTVLEPLESALEDAKDADCLAKGFDAETLDCRVCNLLALTLSLELEVNASQAEAALAASKQVATENAVAKCQRCCTDVEAIDALTHTPQYAHVVLEVCTCKFGRLPKIANFVHNHATKHARLEVEYINARMPHLLFYDDNGDKQEEISIASWDEETISEFIEAKLKPVEENEPTAEEPTSDDTNQGESNEEDKAEVKADEPNDEQEQTTEDDQEEVVEVEVSADAQ